MKVYLRTKSMYLFNFEVHGLIFLLAKVQNLISNTGYHCNKLYKL